MRLDSELVSRVRGGDREALAQFILQHEHLIRARFRDGLASAGSRLNDTSDFVATIARRFLGVFSCSIASRLADADSLAHTLQRIMIEAAKDYTRTASAERQNGRGGLAVQAEVKSREAAPITTGPELLAETDASLAPVDRQILRLRAEGSQHRTIADALGMSVAAVRMRWSRITSKLKGKTGSSGG